MTRRTKQIGVILCLVATVCFAAAWPIYQASRIKAVRAGLLERTKSLVDKNPQLQPEWDKAMQDDVLTLSEAKVIVELTCPPEPSPPGV